MSIWILTTLLLYFWWIHSPCKVLKNTKFWNVLSLSVSSFLSSLLLIKWYTRLFSTSYLLFYMLNLVFIVFQMIYCRYFHSFLTLLSQKNAPSQMTALSQMTTPSQIEPSNDRMHHSSKIIMQLICHPIGIAITGKCVITTRTYQPSCGVGRG